jgi:hypothetical protein
MITIGNEDPLNRRLPDPSNTFFEPFFDRVNLTSRAGLIARRLYVYSTLVANFKEFNNSDRMRSRITDIWMNKNKENDFENQNRMFMTLHFLSRLITKLKFTKCKAIHETQYYSLANTRQMFSNFVGIPFFRATYTQAVNGIDPALLFYQAPSQVDFNDEFLNSKNPYLMGFCFRNCFNYRQSILLISPKFTQNRVSRRKIIFGQLSLFMIYLFEKNSSWPYWTQ